MTKDEGERIAKLETDVAHMRRTQDAMSKKVDTLNEAFMQARGAKWVIITLWIGVGAAVANVKWLLMQLGVKFD